jgi:hypothetical protein
MRSMRATWGSRLIAGGLLACLLASVLGAGLRGGAHPPACASYAAWLRAQLRVPADAVLDHAIGEAAASKARTLTAFLTAFVEAYEAKHPPAALAAAFLPHDLSNEALITYLESRFDGVGGAALPVRTTSLSAPVPAGKVPDRFPLGTIAAATRDLVAPVVGFVDLGGARPLPVRLLRVLSAARPLGP